MPSIRCPSCSSAQPDANAVCAHCGASLTEIVVGYAGRDELATDRESLEDDGWQIVGIADGDGRAPLTVRYQRGALATQRLPATERDRNEKKRAASWKKAIVAAAGLIIVAVAVGAGARWATGPRSAAAVTPSPVTVSIEGAVGVAFAGSISGSGPIINIQGAVPQTYRVDPSAQYSIVVQKQADNPSLLTVTLACAGGATFSSSTSVGHGVVTLSGSCETAR